MIEEADAPLYTLASYLILLVYIFCKYVSFLDCQIEGLRKSLPHSLMQLSFALRQSKHDQILTKLRSPVVTTRDCSDELTSPLIRWGSTYLLLLGHGHDKKSLRIPFAANGGK